MNRNAESYFSLAPTSLEMKRSVFDRSHDLKTTFNAGKLIPFYLEQDVLPGDTFNLDFGAVVRMTPSVHPTMDNCYLDTFFFFVPYRLVWSHWKEFCGENSSGYWIPQTQYSIPQLTISSGSSLDGFEQGSVADYMGLPTKVKGLSVSALPFRAYALIFNEWFRSENLQTPCLVSTSDTNVTYYNKNFSYVNGAYRGGALCPVDKYFDFYTSMLPAPQKSYDITIPLGSSHSPLFGEVTNVRIDNVDYTTPFAGVAMNNMGAPVFIGTGSTSADLKNQYFYKYADDTDKTWDDYLNKPLLGTQYLTTGTSPDYSLYTGSGDITDPRLSGALTGMPLVPELNAQGEQTGRFYVPHIYTDISASGATINQLRTAFQIQRFYEKQAYGGSRYTELVRSMFGVVSPDARLQRPEYLGGSRIPINISQVVQTSSTDEVSPQANVAAYSLTQARDKGFRYSATEHGIILGLCCVRTDHTYQQGIHPGFLRKTIFDFYWPCFAHLGNMPYTNATIYAQGSGVVNPATGVAYDDEVFGYQEAWADYRYGPSNKVTGQFRSNATGTLDSWHYADNYTSLPTLSSDWIQETDVNINRTLAVSSSVADQFIADFYFKVSAYRCMPVFSVPGYMDHY